MKDRWVENMKLKGKKHPAVTELMGFWTAAASDVNI